MSSGDLSTQSKKICLGEMKHKNGKGGGEGEYDVSEMGKKNAA
jgi:hypothetical protein